MTVLIIAVIGMSVADYILYNIWGKYYSNQYINLYRVFFAVLQAVTAHYLFTIDIMLSIKFILSWWLGLWDLLYYCIDYTIHKAFGKSFENGVFFKWDKEINLSWLTFTVYGLILYLLTKKYLTKQNFIVQAIAGMIILFI